MELYTYKGISAGKYIEGVIEALNQDEASHKLKEQKVIITNLERSKKKKGEKKEKAKGGGFSFFKQKVKPIDVVIFTKQFATMVKAGLPILQVLDMLAGQLENPTMKEVVADIKKKLEGGTTLSKCFEDRKSTRLNSSHVVISYAVFCLKKKIKNKTRNK